MSDVISPSWGIPITMVDMDKIKVREIAKNDGDSEIYEIYYEDEEDGHLYFALPSATTSYSQISPMEALRSSKFTVTKKNAKLTLKFNVSDEKKLLEFVRYCNGKLIDYAMKNLDIEKEKMKIWNMKMRGDEQQFVCNRMAYTERDSISVPHPIRVWKKELNEVSLIPVTNLIRATVHVSVNFILIVGTHTGIKSTFLKDVLLKKKENRTKFDAAALDFFGEFETPKKRPHEDIVVSSTTTTTKSKRLSSRKKK